MIPELIMAAILALTGFGLLLAVGRGFGGALPWVALPMGAAVYLSTALLMLVVGGTFDPAMGLVITAVVGVVVMVVSIARGTWSRQTLLWALLAVGVGMVTVVVARSVHLTRLTPDSLRYLLFAREMQLPDALSEIHRADFVNRQMGLPALHSMSSLTDRRYLTSIGPLFGVSGFGLFVWLCWRAVRGLVQSRRLLLVGSAALFLVSSNRLVYDAFYVNTHIEVAFYTLVAIAGAWLAVTTREWSWAIPAGIGLAMTLLFRPEAPIVAAIILVAIGASDAGWRVRLAMTVPMVVITALWYGVILWQNASGGDTISPTAPVFGSLVAVVGAVMVVAWGSVDRLRPLMRYIDRVMLAAMLVVAVALAAFNPEVFTSSLEAAFQNTVLSQGAWLFTWSVGIPLLILALLVHDVPHARLWTVPIVGFGLLWFLLPMIRDGAYRVGTGDSGSRILAHMLAVVVAFLVLAALGSWSRDGSESRLQGMQSGVTREVEEGIL